MGDSGFDGAYSSYRETLAWVLIRKRREERANHTTMMSTRLYCIILKCCFSTVQVDARDSQYFVSCSSVLRPLKTNRVSEWCSLERCKVETHADFEWAINYVLEEWRASFRSNFKDLCGGTARFVGTCYEIEEVVKIKSCQFKIVGFATRNTLVK